MWIDSGSESLGVMWLAWLAVLFFGSAFITWRWLSHRERVGPVHGVHLEYKGIQPREENDAE